MSPHSGVVAALTPDQLTALRLARGDCLPANPYERPRTRFQDRYLLLALRLIERRGAVCELTPLGAAYLRRVDAEMLADRWEEPLDARQASG